MTGSSKKAAIVILPRALGSTVTIPLEMFQAANDVAMAQRQGSKVVSLSVVGETLAPVKLVGGLSLAPSLQATADDHYDLVFIPGIWGSIRASLRRNQWLLPWLRRQADAGTTLCAITTGSHFLAEAGLLDNRVATTHWRYFDQFSARYPDVELQTKKFVTRHDNLYCTGSVNAARNLMIHFIERFHGEEVAAVVARHFTHELKRSHELIQATVTGADAHHDEEIIKLQEWLKQHCTREINLPDLCKRFGFSRRTLARRFKAACNCTPMQYLRGLRIDLAKSLLRETNLSIAEIATQTGFSEPSHFSSVFKLHCTVAPRDYRALVRKKQFVAEQLGPLNGQARDSVSRD